MSLKFCVKTFTKKVDDPWPFSDSYLDNIKKAHDEIDQEITGYLQIIADDNGNVVGVSSSCHCVDDPYMIDGCGDENHDHPIINVKVIVSYEPY